MREERLATMRLIRWISREMGMLLFGRRAAQKAALGLHAAVEQTGSEGDVAKALWRGATVQMKAVNTATAWPIRRRREMRAEAEARLDRYFAQVERMIGQDPGLEKPSRRAITH